MPRRRADLPPAVAGPNGLPFDYAPPRTRRPRIVGIVGWVCAGLGYASFFLKGSQLPVLFMDMTWLNPQWRPMPFSPGQFTAAVFLLLAEMLVALACMSGGIGTLKMREWGRRLLIYYGVAAIALTLLKSAWQVHMFDFMLDYQLSTTTQPVDRTLVGNKAFFALVTSTLMQLTWPIIVISLMTRRYVKDAFGAAVAGADDGWQSNTNGSNANGSNVP